MTLSSRDPHLGQRIVWKRQLPYHSLWCQCFFNFFPLEHSLLIVEAHEHRLCGFKLSGALTRRTANDTRFEMQDRATRSATYGPWLVGLGAALWGTESAWRIPLNELFDAKVIVFWEHVFILILFLPILISRLDEIPRVRARTWGFLIFSGFAGSAVGTVFFTLALKYGNPTVVNVVLNIQPVISTVGAFFLFGDRLTPRFFLCAGIAILAGIFLSVEHPALIGESFEKAGLNLGTGYALVCALFWGLSTVAGRGTMIGMPLRLAASLRIAVGLICMTLILLA